MSTTTTTRRRGADQAAAATRTAHAEAIADLEAAGRLRPISEAAAQAAAEVWAIIYLRLSDLRNEEALDGREEKMRAFAASLGVRVAEVIVENDMTPGADGKLRPASAFKRRKITLPSGETALRTVRPGFRKLLAAITAGARTGVTVVLVEDLDRLLRQPRDNEDMLDAVELSGATVRSRSGSITLTDGGTADERFIARMMANVANKGSADTSRRVRYARERLRGQSYGGGLRPYGFQHDPKAAKYHRTLIAVAAEAEVLTEATADLLDRGLTLRAIAAGLRAAEVPTVTGAKWTPQLVRDVLLKPAIAGLTPDGAGGLTDAPWEGILTVARWEQLRDMLTDPRRTVTPGNTPRWLVSIFAECGICGAPVRATKPTDARRAYQPECGHVKRVIGDAGRLDGPPAGVDEFIAQLVVARLGMPDAAALLRPAPARHVNAAKLRAERRELAERKRGLARMFAAGDLDGDDLAEGSRAIAARLAAIDAALSAADTPDPLADFRGRPAAEVWAGLSMPRRRAVVQTLIASVKILPAGRGAQRFNPASVAVAWRAETS